MSDFLSADDALDALSDIGDEAVETEEIIEDTEQPDDIQADSDDIEEPETAIDDVDEEDEQNEPETAIDPPSFLDASEREAFESLPTEAKQALVRQSQLVQADYTRKTQEIAQKNRQADQILQQLEGVVSEQHSRLQEWKKVDWKALADQDPNMYVKAKAEYEQEVADYQQTLQRKTQAETTRIQAHTQEQMQQLKTVLPEALDPKTGPQLARDIQTALAEAGTSPQGMQQVTAGQMALVADALKWRKAQADQKSLRPKADAKTTAKPLRSKRRASTSKRANSTAKFRKAPSRANALDALMALDD